MRAVAGNRNIDSKTLYDPTTSCAYYLTFEFFLHFILSFSAKYDISPVVGPINTMPGSAYITSKHTTRDLKIHFSR